MNPTKINLFGMELDQWQHKSCTASVGKGDDWATIYVIESKEQGNGHGAELIVEMHKFYEAQNKEFGSSVALNPNMRKLLKKLKIKEYR